MKVKNRYIIGRCIAVAIGAVGPAMAGDPQSDYYQACMALDGGGKDRADCTERAAKYILDKAADDRKAAQETERKNALARGLINPTATASLPFAEVFPTDAAEAECAKWTDVPTYNDCIDSVQTYYDYDRTMWTSLQPGRRQFCIIAAEKFPRDSGFYQLLEPCLENEVRLQDQETAHILKAW